LKFGGTQRQALELARRLDPAQFQPEIWLLAGGDDLSPPAREAGIPLTWLSRREQVLPPALLHLWRLLRHQDYDLLLLFTVVPNIWGRILGRLVKAPAIVGNCRGGAAPRRQGERWLWPLAQHIVCNSGNLKRVLTRRCGVPEARISVIPNGVEVDFFRPAPEGTGLYPDVVLSLARMVPDKDLDTLIRAFALARPNFPQAQLWLVGEGPLEGDLRRQAAALLPPESYRFIQPQMDLRPLFRQAGMLALSSRTEAMPNVILEAMAAGLPVAATAVGGVPELVRPARTGWLVPPEDPEELAAALVRLLGNPEQCRAFGREARRRVVRDFSMSAMVSRYEEVLRAFVKGGGSV